MGQKVSPHGLRVGVIKEWNAQWYADKKELFQKPCRRPQNKNLS